MLVHRLCTMYRYFPVYFVANETVLYGLLLDFCTFFVPIFFFLLEFRCMLFNPQSPVVSACGPGKCAFLVLCFEITVSWTWYYMERNFFTRKKCFHQTDVLNTLIKIQKDIVTVKTEKQILHEKYNPSTSTSYIFGLENIKFRCSHIHIGLSLNCSDYSIVFTVTILDRERFWTSYEQY